MALPALRPEGRVGQAPSVTRAGARVALVAGLAVAYVVAHPVLFRILGPDLAALFVMSVMPASLAYGLRGGVAAGLVALPVNMALLARLGPEALRVLGSDWAGAATGLFLGVAAGAGRDLFERLRTEALRREIAQLTRAERELARANRELDRAREAAERAAAAKTMLLGRASHELRTPTAAILGYVEMLREEMQAGAVTSLERDLEHVHVAARHLSALLDDLLDVARLESGHFTPRLERVNVGELLGHVAIIGVPLAARRQNALTVSPGDGSLEVVTDRGRLEQILLNLVANAAKFTTRGHITIRAARARTDAGEVLQLGVSDTGIGMTAEQAEHAFEEFYQADPSASLGGTGLGLAITRHLCERLGAALTLETAPGKGTTVTVAFPPAR